MPLAATPFVTTLRKGVVLAAPQDSYSLTNSQPTHADLAAPQDFAESEAVQIPTNAVVQANPTKCTNTQTPPSRSSYSNRSRFKARKELRSAKGQPDTLAGYHHSQIGDELQRGTNNAQNLAAPQDSEQEDAAIISETGFPSMRLDSPK